MEKKDQILKVALRLFADKGFHAVSTASIAKAAEVSEGLIFKHYKTKKGLLEAIMDLASQKLVEEYSTLLASKDADEILKLFIESPYNVKENDYDFWRLVFKLKWDQDFYKPEKIQPIIDHLTYAFKQKGYAKPKIEAEILNQNIESIGIGILREGKKSQVKFKAFLKSKYLNN